MAYKVGILNGVIYPPNPYMKLLHFKGITGFKIYDFVFLTPFGLNLGPVSAIKRSKRLTVA